MVPRARPYGGSTAARISKAGRRLSAFGGVTSRRGDDYGTLHRPCGLRRPARRRATNYLACFAARSGEGSPTLGIRSFYSCSACTLRPKSNVANELILAPCLLGDSRFGLRLCTSHSRDVEPR